MYIVYILKQRNDKMNELNGKTTEEKLEILETKLDAVENLIPMLTDENGLVIKSAISIGGMNIDIEKLIEYKGMFETVNLTLDEGGDISITAPTCGTGVYAVYYVEVKREVNF